MQIKETNTTKLKFRNIIHSKKRSLGLIEDNHDDGENINDDDGELGKTLSFIKCKPSLIKSNNTQPNLILNSQRNVQSFKIKSNVQDSHFNEETVDCQSKFDLYQDK